MTPRVAWLLLGWKVGLAGWAALLLLPPVRMDAVEAVWAMFFEVRDYFTGHGRARQHFAGQRSAPLSLGRIDSRDLCAPSMSSVRHQAALRIGGRCSRYSANASSTGSSITSSHQRRLLVGLTERPIEHSDHTHDTQAGSSAITSIPNSARRRSRSSSVHDVGQWVAVAGAGGGLAPAPHHGHGVRVRSDLARHPPMNE